MQLSVVMAVYNGEEYLIQAVESVLNQTYKDFEFIIVNDGSTDKTKEILNHIHDSRVRIFHLESNCGLPYSLNFGIKQSKGDWIVRQDADDVSLQNRFEEQVKYIKENPGIVGVGTLIQSIHGNSVIDDEYLRSIEWSNSVVTKEEIEEFRFIAPPVIHGTMFFSKVAFQAVGGYNEHYKIGQDFDLWMRLIEIGSIEKIPQVLYQYRVDSRSLSNKDEARTCEESLQIASGHIHNVVRKNIGKTPRFAIIGSSKGCEFFVNKVCPIHHIIVKKVCKYENEIYITKLYNKFYRKKIDAIIVLDGRKSDIILNRLKSKGMIMNKNLFRLWNIFE
ncbi:glycosyltransferase [Ectobacillus polymachus]|uniref:glycosyltransferase n=1 Tax=Ectobacillus polymachus TaxID=1508806 RepID=UPI003A8A533E